MLVQSCSVSKQCKGYKCTVFCKSLDPPIISLYFARKRGNMYRDFLKYAKINGKKYIRQKQSSKVDIWFHYLYSSTQPELSQASLSFLMLLLHWHCVSYAKQ